VPTEHEFCSRSSYRLICEGPDGVFVLNSDVDIKVLRTTGTDKKRSPSACMAAFIGICNPGIGRPGGPHVVEPISNRFGFRLSVIVAIPQFSIAPNRANFRPSSPSRFLERSEEHQPATVHLHMLKRAASLPQSRAQAATINSALVRSIPRRITSFDNQKQQ